MSQQPIQKYQVETDIPFKKNAVINGDFNIWQRGTSFPAMIDNTYNADRWVYSKLGSTAVHTGSQSTDVPTVAQAGRLFTFSHRLALTVADTTIAAGDQVHIAHRIEGFNFISLAQRPMILSFWVKAGIAGTYCCAFTNTADDRTYVAEYTINTINTWEYKTITILASPSAGTWNYSNGVGLRVRFTLAVGTTFQTTANVWQTGGTFYGTSNQVNGVNTGAGNFLLTGVQLESGSVVTEIEQRTFNEELMLCQRYYERYDNITPNRPYAFPGHVGGPTTIMGMYLKFAVEKRADPALFRSALSTFEVEGSINNNLTPTAVTLAHSELFNAQVNFTCAVTIGSFLSYVIVRNDTSSVVGFLAFDAEL